MSSGNDANPKAPKQAKTEEPTDAPPARPKAATLQDVRDWLSQNCLPTSHISWLAASPELTAEFAYGDLQDAVFGRGSFREWKTSAPSNTGDLHWSEMGGSVDDLVMDEMDDDDYSDAYDVPMETRVMHDTFEEAQREHLNQVYQDRYEQATYRLQRIQGILQKTNTRKRALELLTAWLATNSKDKNSKLRTTQMTDWYPVTGVSRSKGRKNIRQLRDIYDDDNKIPLQEGVANEQDFLHPDHWQVSFEPNARPNNKAAAELALSLFPQALPAIFETRRRQKEEHGSNEGDDTKSDDVTRRKRQETPPEIAVRACRQLIRESTTTQGGDGDTTNKDEDAGFQQAVLDELLILLMGYKLLTDFRRNVDEPCEPEDLHLPFWASMRYSYRDDCWWPNEGQHRVEQTVPWSGRGSMAKLVLLGHALVCSVAKRLPPESKYASGYCYTEMLRDILRELKTSLEPFVLMAALRPVRALIAFGAFDSEIYESQIWDYRFGILPALQRLFDDQLRLECFLLQSSSKSSHSPAEEFPLDCLKVARERVHLMKDEEKQQLIRDAASHPVQLPDPTSTATTTPTTMLLLDMIADCLALAESNFANWTSDRGVPVSEVKRLRLSGNHNGEYLMEMASAFQGITILDAQGCQNLDQDVLKAMAASLHNVKYLLLGGTSVPEESSVVQELRTERRIVVDFTQKRCRHCGQLSD